MSHFKLGFQFSAFLFFTSTYFPPPVQSICNRGCDLAFGSYYIHPGNDLSSISQFLHTNTTNILNYNRNTIPNPNNLPVFTRINVPFTCDCIGGEFLAHVFKYEFRSVDVYEIVAEDRYANLTTREWIRRVNGYDETRVPDGVLINVPVNCSCGDRSVSKDYGLFVTYPLRPGESLESVSSAANLSSDLIRRYNPGADFSRGSGLVYIPARDENGNYPPLKTRSGLSSGAIAGITVGVAVMAVLFIAGCLYIAVGRMKPNETSSVLLQNSQVQLMPAQAPSASFVEEAESGGVSAGGLTGVTIDKAVEFSYEELSNATNDFNLEYKFGEGGYGAVYYAELRGEKAAIKKMDMQASKEFLAELKVLTRTHHRSLVRLIGYCAKDSLFLVYEYIENGNLSQHLHGSGSDPLTWFTRVRIALDSAQGLEYIHEHTVPAHVHCDIKSANILINKNLRGKVADFGLARLNAVVGSKSRLGGTFGYMPPEYLRYGHVSPKVDVYAFGVVLYELISAQKAVIKANNSDSEDKGLIALFDKVLSQQDPKDGLVQMVDLRLKDNYPLVSVYKMAQLAKACTHKDPQQRPSMKFIVVALMNLHDDIEEDNPDLSIN